MRLHLFNYDLEFRIPRVVLSPKLVALGVSAPLHPFFKDICEWFDIAPIQLSPNNYKMAIALCMMYVSLDSPSLVCWSLVIFSAFVKAAWDTSF